MTLLATCLPALLRFAIASAACALLGLVLAGLLRRAARRWPALAAHRSIWLSAQAALLLAFALALAPLPRADVAPALALPAAQPEPAPLSGRAVEAAHESTDAGADADAAPAAVADALAYGAALWAALYAGGLAWTLDRRWRTARRWRIALRAHVRPLDPHALAAWPGATAGQIERIVRGRLAVAATDLPLSPMLLGVLRPRLLLPARLAGLDAAQRALVVEHELTHWRRRDPLWLAASGAIGALLWFVPACRAFDAALREAVELGCDDAVLADRPAAERRSYAAALVAQLRLQQPACAAPAFGQLGVAARVARMRDARPARLSGRARGALAAAAALLAAGTAALQPALSNAAPGLPPAAPAAAAAIAATPWRYPLADARVTALYGVRSAHVPQGHHGVDFAAKRGTPVLAVADGTVSEAGTDPTWGNYVLIGHGAGRASLVMHLDRIDVARGQQVAAGQPVGTAGASGSATGPHLHLEYRQDGKRADPGLMFADLDRHATPRGLARRAAQGHPHPIDG